MSGHSHWATIKRAKGAADAKKGKVFSKLGKEITIVVKAKGGNPDNNPTLRTLIAKAKAAQMAREKAEAEENAKKLDGIQVIIRAKAGSSGKLFGAVTSQEISDALKEQHGIDIEKNKIIQADPIKTFGSYQVKAKLGYEVNGTVNVLVVEDK